MNLGCRRGSLARSQGLTIREGFPCVQSARSTWRRCRRASGCGQRRLPAARRNPGPGRPEPGAAPWRAGSAGGSGRPVEQAVLRRDHAAQGNHRSHVGAFLPDIQRFDAEFFGISPREAREMDPQQRVLLEVAWEALDGSRLPGRRTGPAAPPASSPACSPATTCCCTARPVAPTGIDPFYATGKEFSFGAGRIAYSFDLHGPVMTITTACSSSLLAVHLACQSLRAGECDAALAGGVNLLVAPELTVFMSQVGAVSPTGRSAPFSATADGVVRGEGCALVLLEAAGRRRARWRPDVAVINGSAVNHDGRSAGLTVPNAARRRLGWCGRRCTVPASQPEEIGYLEAHATGTPLGDPIELAALQRSSTAMPPQPARCWSARTRPSSATWTPPPESSACSRRSGGQRTAWCPRSRIWPSSPRTSTGRAGGLRSSHRSEPAGRPPMTAPGGPESAPSASAAPTCTSCSASPRPSPAPARRPAATRPAARLVAVSALAGRECEPGEQGPPTTPQRQRRNAAQPVTAARPPPPPARYRRAALPRATATATRRHRAARNAGRGPDRHPGSRARGGPAGARPERHRAPVPAQRPLLDQGLTSITVGRARDPAGRRPSALPKDPTLVYLCPRVEDLVDALRRA